MYSVIQWNSYKSYDHPTVDRHLGEIFGGEFRTPESAWGAIRKAADYIQDYTECSPESLDLKWWVVDHRGEVVHERPAVQPPVVDIFAEARRAWRALSEEERLSILAAEEEQRRLRREAEMIRCRTVLEAQTPDIQAPIRGVHMGPNYPHIKANGPTLFRWLLEQGLSVITIRDIHIAIGASFSRTAFRCAVDPRFLRRVQLRRRVKA